MSVKAISIIRGTDNVAIVVRVDKPELVIVDHGGIKRFDRSCNK
jgi:hypothetical protein